MIVADRYNGPRSISGIRAPGSRGMALRTLRGSVSKETLNEIIRRIVEVAEPEKIVMFGSAARGEMGPNSDVDLLVIKRGPFHRGHLTGDIYMNLFGVGQAVDVIVVTPEDVERYRNSRALVIGPALREGKLVYAV